MFVSSALMFMTMMLAVGSVGRQASKKASTTEASTGSKAYYKKDGTLDARVDDLQELCKDWKFSRRQILLAHAEGDDKNVAYYRAMFQRVNRWLDEYREEDVAKECGKEE
jgi:hypothetical protein